MWDNYFLTHMCVILIEEIVLEDGKPDIEKICIFDSIKLSRIKYQVFTKTCEYLH